MQKFEAGSDTSRWLCLSWGASRVTCSPSVWVYRSLNKQKLLELLPGWNSLVVRALSRDVEVSGSDSWCKMGRKEIWTLLSHIQAEWPNRYTSEPVTVFLWLEIISWMQLIDKLGKVFSLTSCFHWKHYVGKCLVRCRMSSVFWFFTAAGKDKSACTKWKLWGNLKMLSCHSHLELRDWRWIHRIRESYRLGSKVRNYWEAFLVSFSIIWADPAKKDWRHLNCSVSLIWEENAKFGKDFCSLVRVSNALLKNWEAGAGYRPLWGLTALFLLPLQATVYVRERCWRRWSFSSSSAACCRHSSSLCQRELRNSTQTLSLGAQWNPIHTSCVQFFARLQGVTDFRMRHCHRFASVLISLQLWCFSFLAQIQCESILVVLYV